MLPILPPDMLPIDALPIHAELARSLILLMPVLGLGMAFWIKRPTFFQLVGIMLGVLWNIPFILLLNILAVEQGWWHFAPSPNSFYSVPVELVLGWAFFWGALFPYVFEEVNPLVPILLALLIDLLLMPKLSMLFALGDYWLIGEIVLLSACLLPPLAVYHLTVARRAVLYRVILQSILWAGWNIFLIPAIILYFEGKDFFALLSLDGWHFTFFVNTMAVATVIGYAALYEFARAGEGTPIPFDPPHYLVTTGPYAYVRNPLQIAAFLVFIGIALSLQSTYMVMAMVALLVFSEGFVSWHHEVDIAERFDDAWVSYKREVRNWFPRWKPYVQSQSTVYFSQSCEICQQTERGLRRLQPIGVDFVSAALHPSRDLERVTYRHSSERFEESGVSAVARIFEQINFSFAFLGWLMRLPGITQILQIIMDGSGEQGKKVTRVRQQ